jgi:hypothetical protein
MLTVTVLINLSILIIGLLLVVLTGQEFSASGCKMTGEVSG